MGDGRIVHGNDVGRQIVRVEEHGPRKARVTSRIAYAKAALLEQACHLLRHQHLHDIL